VLDTVIIFVVDHVLGLERDGFFVTVAVEHFYFT